MATLIRNRWTSSFEGMSRRDRQGCNYDAYLPDPLTGWDLALPADLAADISDAEGAIRRLNTAGTSHASLEGLARFLLRAESVASSKIEGLQAGPRRLLDTEVVLTQGGEAADRVAVEVLANVAAMQAAVDLGSSANTITLDDLLDVHRILMERSATPEIGGKARTVQNWIGGSNRRRSRRCSTTCWPTSTATITLRSSKQQSPTRSSRRSTHSPMATGAPAAP